jgi:hypothetical protein
MTDACEIDECEIFNIGKCAIYVWESEIVLRNSLVHDVPESGVSAVACEHSHFLNNRFRNTRSTTLSISQPESVVHVEANVFEDIQEAITTISSSEIQNLEKAGICVRHSQSALLDRNVISHCGECGVSILDTVQCTVTQNAILECAIAGVEIYHESTVVVNQNRSQTQGSTL